MWTPSNRKCNSRDVSHIVKLCFSALICDVLNYVYEHSVPYGTFLRRWNQIAFVSKFGVYGPEVMNAINLHILLLT